MPAADVTLPGLALSTSVLDRRGDLRADPGLLPRLLADRATRVLRLVGDRVAVQPADGGGLAVL
ncbi:MAG: NADH pyrophosphatase, partial [Ornithinibacter sp.]